MQTPKQQKLIKLLIQNLKDKGETESLGKLMLKAGYSEASAHNPKLIIESEAIQEALNPVVEDMEKERDRILRSIKTKDLSEERYKDLVDSIDKLTKNIQLLSGGDTDRQSVNINVIDNYGVDDSS